MKVPLNFLPILLGLASAHADEAPPPLAPGEARIIGEIPDGTPPPPAPPKPGLHVAPGDIISSKTRHIGDRELTVQKLVPLEIPAPPETPAPAESPQTAPEPLAPAKPHEFLMMGASVVRPDGDPEHALTFITLYPQGASAPVQLIAKANFLWLTGFFEFETAGSRYSLNLAISEGAETPPADLTFPDPTKASYVVHSGNPTAADLAPVDALLAIYNDAPTLAKLKTAYAGRQAEAARRAAEEQANPPESRPMTLRYWRLDEAGRNGVQPKPADIR